MNPRIMVVPSKFDHTPLRDALDVLQKHGQDRFVALEAKARDTIGARHARKPKSDVSPMKSITHNWTQKKVESILTQIQQRICGIRISKGLTRIPHQTPGENQ